MHTGNVALKVAESTIEAFGAMLGREFKSSLSARIGYFFVRSAVNRFKKRLDYSEYGGVPLLGVRGVCIICHGRSTPKAIRNAIRVAGDFSRRGINEKIREEILLVESQIGDLEKTPSEASITETPGVGRS